MMDIISTAAVGRIREISPDAKAVCTNGDFFFRSCMVKLGSKVLSEFISAAGYRVSINKTMEITKHVFDYVQFGDLPGFGESIQTLVEIYSMAEEYDVAGLCEAMKTRLGS